MKTVQHRIPALCIEAFAEQNDLTMETRERKKPIGDPTRFYAQVADAEVKDGRCLVGCYGNGATPEDAIKDYAKEIELKTIVIGAFSPNRKEIEVPRLVHTEAPK